jgi:hypothetical protein
MGKTLIIAALAFCTGTELLSQASFSDISVQAGVNQIGLNYGVAIGDFNNDGLEDIFATRMVNGGTLYRNNGSAMGGILSFQNVTQAAGINPAPTAQFAIWGDVDNDGWLDLFLGARDEGNALYRNNQDGTFTDVTSAAGVATGGRVKSALFADVDMDGWLDIYIARLGWENILYRNNQDGTFTDITVQAGVTDASISMGAIFFDYDNDGDPDLYLTHDANVPNILYRNNGNPNGTGVTFTNVSNQTGTNIAAMGMGVDVADINNDGWLDIYITNLGANTLLLNNGNPGGFGHYFWSIAELAGVADPGMGWGCSFFDYDNDGWQDLYVANDSYFSPFPNLLYRNNANPSPSGVSFAVTSEGTVLHSMEGGYGFGCFDMDNDGLLDIYLANYGGDVGNQLFKNTLSNTNNWLKIKVIGVESNKSGIGARAVLKIGSRSLMDEVNGGNSWASQSSLVLHFGLGTASTVDLLTVRWPSGIVDSFENVAANQVLEVTEGESTVSETDPTQGPQIDSLPEQFVEGPFGYGLSGSSNANLLDGAISIMPNPFNEELAVVFNKKALYANVLEIRLLDGAGRELVQQKIKRKPTVLSINTQNVPAGLYYLQIITEQGTITLKAMKL